MGLKGWGIDFSCLFKQGIHLLFPAKVLFLSQKGSQILFLLPIVAPRRAGSKIPSPPSRLGGSIEHRNSPGTPGPDPARPPGPANERLR